VQAFSQKENARQLADFFRTPVLGFKTFADTLGL
jgi:hypothetical protein